MKRRESGSTLRIQCRHEPIPPWKRTTSGPLPRRCTAIRGAGSGRTSQLRPHALGEDRHLLVELAAVGGQELEDQVLDAARRPARRSGRPARPARRPARVRRAKRPARSGPGLQHVDVVAKRERRGRRAAASLAESRQLGPARPQLLRRTIDRMPRGAESGRAAQRGPAVAADPDRRVRLLHGLGLEDESAELRVLAGERRRSAVHSSCIARRYSSVIGAALGERARPASRSRRPPSPRRCRSTTRPPLSASSEEIILAVTTALR